MYFYIPVPIITVDYQDILYIYIFFLSNSELSQAVDIYGNLCVKPCSLASGEYFSAGIFKQSMGAGNRGGIRLSYRPGRLHSLAVLVPWNRFLGSLKVKKFRLSSHVRLFRASRYMYR